MDVRLPDGTVITNVPEGTTQDELMRRVSGLNPKAQEQARQKNMANTYAGKDMAQMGTGMRFLGGAKAAWDRAALGMKDLFTDLTPEDRALLEGGRAFTDQGGTAATVGSIGADVAMSLAPGAAAAKGVQLTTRGAPVLKKALANVLAQTGVGAGYGALTSPEDRSGGATAGAVGTMLGMGAARVASGAVKPFMKPESRALVREGIVPTPGQAVGGALGDIEQKFASVPILGSMVKSARNRAVDEFNEIALQKAAGVRGIGDEAMTTARESIGARYDQALGAMPPVKLDEQSVLQATVNAVDDPALNLAQGSKDNVLRWVEANILQRGRNMTGEQAKQIESDLGTLVRGYKGSSNAEERSMGRAFEAIYDQFRTSLTLAADTVGQGRALRDADAAWRAFLPIDKAASSAGAQGAEVAGRFTPRMLRRAIEQMDRSQNNNITRAAALRGDVSTPFNRVNTLTRQAEAVLPDRVPDSGTAGRIAAMTGIGAGGYAVGTGGLAYLPEAVAAYGLGKAMTSRRASKFILEGFEPAYNALVRNGMVPSQIDQIVRQYGPEAVVNLARSMSLEASR